MAANTAVATAADAPAAAIGFSPTRPSSGPVVKTDRGYMVAYEATIPGTDVKFEMVPIPGGKFKLGSPAGEAKRNKNEGPQVEIEVAPFWMGKHEVTWNEYERYMGAYQPFKDLKGIRHLLSFDATTLNVEKPDVRDRLKPLFDKVRADASAFATLSNEEKELVLPLLRRAQTHDAIEALLAKPEFALLRKHLERPNKLGDADAVTAPSLVYTLEDVYYGVDDKRQPAVTMTQFAARQYTKWLSKLTGEIYRLPSEAEWEYACRAGTTTAYHFGDDAKQLGDYAWTFDNSNDRSHVVGRKKPNPWGLYDMHGNVAEWVHDELIDDHYAKLTARGDGPVAASDAVAWPTKLYPRVIRGGGWDSDPPECRSAARRGSDDRDWKTRDPDRPPSPWWFSEDAARAVGMRLVRPLDVPSDAELEKCWEVDVAEVAWDVKVKIEIDARGHVEPVDRHLPELVKQVEALQKEFKAINEKFWDEYGK